jgi:predicted Zn-dependent protease
MMHAHRRDTARCAAILLIGVTAVSGCKGGRFGNMYSRSDEVKLGQEFAQEYERKEKFVTSGPQYDRLQRVAARILPLAKQDWDVPYKVQLVESKDVNAFAVPGGPIYFYTGLMDLADSDDEVASVMGHEVTHTVKRHSAKQMSDANTKGLLASLVLGGSNRNAQTIAGLALQLQSLRYGRDDESQADEYGFKYLVQAGYNPDAMASFFAKMGAQSKGGGAEWLSSHPLTNKRVENAKQRAQAVRAGTYKAPK